MNTPSGRHAITIEPCPDRVVVTLGGEVVADSRSALCLRETGYPPVLYLPRRDVREAALVPSALTTHCPFKGNASYWTLVAGDRESAEAAWSYQEPVDAVAAIAGHLAFHPERVDAIEVSQTRRA